MDDEASLRRELDHQCKSLGSRRAFALKHGFSPQYISDVLKGRRDISERLGNALGYKRINGFIKDKSNPEHTKGAG